MATIISYKWLARRKKFGETLDDVLVQHTKKHITFWTVMKKRKMEFESAKVLVPFLRDTGINNQFKYKIADVYR
jgi:hypothetical protein